MSVATKQELEAVIAAIFTDIAETRDEVKSGRGAGDPYQRGFVAACDGALELLGIAVKTYRIHIPNEEETNA